MVEEIVYVDENGSPTGETAPKLEAHTEHTKLHLAFSCYVFDEQGRFLVTQRALSKKVWPGVWTNSVCGHPAPGEDMQTAIQRRLAFELGMTAKDFTVILPTYRYKTPPFNGIIENEFCPVYVAIATCQPKPNPDEVEAYKWMEWKDFVQEASNDTKDLWSWWCKDQLKQLQNSKVFEKFLQDAISS